MKHIKTLRLLLSVFVLTIMQNGCAASQSAESPSPEASLSPGTIGQIEIGLHKITEAQLGEIIVLDSLPEAPDGNITRIDLGNCDVSGLDLLRYDSLLPQVRFNTKTVWPEKLPENFDPMKIIELGKDPGLNVRDLHTKGIDGSGVSIGIVDVTLFTGHNEYKDNLVYYEDIPKSDAEWHMHGAGVASLAVGKTTGVAPGAKLYFIEASWEDDKGAEGETTYRYYAQGIHRLLDINKQLPEDEKIRVISISAYPSPDHGVNDYEDYADALERAKSEGVFIIAVSSEEDYGFRFGGLGREPMSDPNALNSYYAAGVAEWMDEGRIFFPMGSRSFASYIGEDVYSWVRPGGASWTAPYIAGLYALAAQVYGEITPDIFWQAVEETANKVMDKGYGKEILVCNPIKLIETISER